VDILENRVPNHGFDLMEHSASAYVPFLNLMQDGQFKLPGKEATLQGPLWMQKNAINGLH
jgi:hypothetical protein